MHTTVAQSPSRSTAADAPDYRAGRFAARHWLWSHSTATRPGDSASGTLPARHRLCGRVSRANGSLVGVRVSTAADGTRTAGWSGVQSCGSVWCCPVCSARIMAERQAEVQGAVQAWTDLGHDVVFATFTMRHYAGQRLRTLWDGVGRAWNAVTSGRAWKVAQSLVGVVLPRVVRSGARKGQTVEDVRVPFIRAVEVTHGVNGWHVHLHVLFFVRASHRATDGAWTRFAHGLWTRWRDGLVALGFEAPALPYGFDLRRVDPAAAADALSRYVTKSVYSAAAEVTRADVKGARSGNRTPYEILRGLVVTYQSGDLGDLGTAEDDEIWGEWERAAHGRRQITWSPGLRDFLDLGEELTDEDIADAELDGEDVVLLAPELHSAVIAARVDYSVLVAFAVSDAAGLELLRALASDPGHITYLGPPSGGL